MRICSKESNSGFRLENTKQATSFSYSKLERELEEKAPTIYRILNRICHNKKNVQRRKSKTPEACVPALVNGFAVLLYTRTQQMNACQTINTYILKKGQAKIQTYDRFEPFFFTISITLKEETLAGKSVLNFVQNSEIWKIYFLPNILPFQVYITLHSF